MGTLQEDIDKYGNELGEAITRRDVLAGLGALAKIGGQFSAAFAVAYAAMVAGALASAVLGPLGLAIPTGAITILAREATRSYSRLNSNQRKGVNVILGLLMGKISFSRIDWKH
jgi:hypothetical protein